MTFSNILSATPHVLYVIMVFAFHAVVYLVRSIPTVCIAAYHHPMVDCGILFALAVLVMTFCCGEPGYSEGYAPSRSYGGSHSDRSATSSYDEPRHGRRDSIDLDFEDYKLTDPDWAIHGYRSGDMIDDQRTHDRWERCND